MKIDELDGEETLAFVALLREIVQADDKYSDAEKREVKKLEARIGVERFATAMQQTRERLPTTEDVKKHAKTITRQEARALIYAELRKVASSDRLVPSEEKPLEWLRGWWQLDKS